MAKSSKSRFLPFLFPRMRARIDRWPWFWRWLVRGTFYSALLGLIALLVLDLVYSYLAGKYDLADLDRMPERTIIYDHQGREIGRLHGENRIVVKLSEVSPHFIEALLAREDNDFNDHGGVSWRGIVRAFYRRIKDGARQGASTITMQLANNSFKLGKNESLHRKLLEMALARRIEANYQKDQILELYVNRVFFGTGIYGVERASQAYFGKKAKDLTADEGAMLAAIIRGPNIFSPFRHPDKARSGRDQVLGRMVYFERLSEEQAEAIKKIQTKILPAPKGQRESWVMDAVGRELDRILDMENVEEGGLKVYTTLDPKLQAAAEQSLERELARIERQPGYEHPTRAQFAKSVKAKTNLEPDYLQGAIVVLDNATGATLAIVGGRDIEDSSWNRAMLARRTIGSTFKPFVYAAAVEQGLLPGTLINDGEIRPGDITSANDPDFRPYNSDKTFTGHQRADWGLAKSRNTMAVRVGEFAGMDIVLDVAERAGFGQIQSHSAQLYLGNTGATLETLTSGFSIFPNAGVRCRPFLIDRIEDNSGGLVFRSGVMNPEVIRPGAAWLTAKMLERVCAPGGTAAEVAGAKLVGPLAGKTGTTDDYRDAWFVGFNPRVTCGVWVGLDDPERIIHRGYGSRLALPVWIEVMRHAQSLGYRGGEWRSPPLRTVDICAASGARAGPACTGRRVRETLPEDCIPPDECPVHTTYTPAPAGTSRGTTFLDRLRGLWR